MEKASIFKGLIAIAVIGISQTSVATQTVKLYKNNIFDSFDVVGDAREGIQAALNADDHNPYFIRRTYEIDNDQVSVTTRTYYREYRKEPAYNKVTFNTGSNIHIDGVNVEGTIEFVYKSSDKNNLTQINKRIKPSNGVKNRKIVFNANDPSSLLKT